MRQDCVMEGSSHSKQAARGAAINDTKACCLLADLCLVPCLISMRSSTHLSMQRGGRV